ncbi:hypothetical protein IV498_12420 [Paenarthrobacter sp. Z7-10]|uniref:beta strand repeat-containing protein n=1 Tax=Paenarthrobacter sp. Z7-10 TaxID=2787635 RepID=UPI0022A9F5B7|nr:Ig-like domain-containing protein [Paenarthrobacter sp. Z7-10]MCZ2403961.1 hypothetical protein [Paenarthrobacter sp. Z7-10]
MKPQPHPPVSARTRWLRTRAPWILAGVLPLAALSSPAYAFWQSQSTGSLSAAADSIAAGGKPSATAAGADVSVRWPASSTLQGGAVAGYVLARYSTATGGTSVPATGGCSGTVTALSCVEAALPVGTWYYAVTPVISLWTGAESPRSIGVNTDKTPPVVSVTSISPAPNPAGFNNSSPVTVNLAADDGTGGSGVASISYSVDAGAQTVVAAASAAVVLTAEGMHTISYFATDNAGNSGTAQTIAVRIDTLAPTGGSVTVPTYVNAGNVAAVPVRGTAEPGSSVTLRVSDAGSVHTLTSTVAADATGAWSVPGLDLSGFNQGTLSFAATAVDAAGNAGLAVVVTSIKDTLSPSIPTVSAPTYVNSANRTNVPVSGTAEAGSTVSLRVTDAGAVHTVLRTATAGGSGAWSVTGLDLSALNDGALTFSAAAADPAGNTGGTGSASSVKDVLVAAPFITAPGTVNSSNATTFPVAGSTEAGASVRLTVSDGVTAHTVTKTAVANGSGSWAASLDLSGMNAGTLSYSAVATDPAGNVSGPGTATGTKAGPKVTAVGLVGGNGVAAAGDSVSITFGQAMNGSTFCSDWTSPGVQTLSGSNDVVVTITNGTAEDTLSVTSTNCPGLKIGSIGLGGDYVSSGSATFSATANGSRSSVSWNPTTATLTITLGTKQTGTLATAPASVGYPSYTPVAGLQDSAGNPLGTTTFTSGTASKF